MTIGGTEQDKRENHQQDSDPEQKYSKSSSVGCYSWLWTTIIMTSTNNTGNNAKGSFSISMIQNGIAVLKQAFQHKRWKGSSEFVLAQFQVAVVLAIAYIGNNWPYSYHRNQNHNPTMFWVMNGALLVAGLCTLHHDTKVSARGVQLLSREQTEEWKGWMQWGFIMYHYYRMYTAYNEIRVFVSAYVWMTGFGNFLYFDKKKDFSLERAVSMWIRINYFPILLSTFINVPLELYYVVPLHTTGFFVTMATCYLSHSLEKVTDWSLTKRNAFAILICLLVHILFYETPAVDVLKLISNEYHFRFQSDKYSAWVGILSGFGWFKFQEYMQWCYDLPEGTIAQPFVSIQWYAMWAQRVAGFGLLFLWYILFGHINDKFVYNPVHPYIFWMPVAGWLMLRNSSKYLTELHAGAMEFFGRITLETYVLQFHVFMCNKVQHIPIVIPGSGESGPLWLKTLNMLLCGSVFLSLAFWARVCTVSTQTTVTELVGLLWRGAPPAATPPQLKSGGDSSSVLQESGGEIAVSSEDEEVIALINSSSSSREESPGRATVTNRKNNGDTSA